MVELLDDQGRRERLAHAGAERVEHEFQWKASAERLHRLYVRLGATLS